MKIFLFMFMAQIILALKQGFFDYSESIKKYDPELTFGIFGFLGSIAGSLFNGVRGAIGGFFGKGGAVTVAGAPQPPVTITPPPPAPTPEKKDNTMLYIGIAGGVIIFVVLIIILTKKS